MNIAIDRPNAALETFPSAEAMVRAWRPSRPIHCLYPSFTRGMARRFLEGARAIGGALVAYREAVEAGEFPSEAGSFFLNATTRQRVDSMLSSHAFEGSHEGVDAEVALAQADSEVEPA